jgi:hypothetical protein
MSNGNMHSTRKIVFRWMGLSFLMVATTFIASLTGNHELANYIIYATVPIFLVAWIHGVVYTYRINKKAYKNIMEKKPIFTDSVFNANEKSANERSSTNPTD